MHGLCGILMRSPFRRLRGQAADDRGSLPLAMLLSLVAASLGALMLPTLVSENTSTRIDISRLHALNAAEAGLNVAVGQIRTAHDASGTGFVNLLPCGPLTGTVSNGEGTTYSVTISYYASDPNTVTAANPVLPCTLGSGPAASPFPNYALLVSTGTETRSGTTTNRTLQSTYRASTTNANTPGGQIQLGTDASLCLDVGSPHPTSNTPLTATDCAATDGGQQFIYTSNLYLEVASTVNDSQPMCLDSGPSPRPSSYPVLVQPCAVDADGKALARRQWEYDDDDRFESVSQANGVNSADNYCMSISLPAPSNTPFTVQACGSSGISFGPSASVGPGMAGESTGQLVNFAEFGRCLDVTQANVYFDPVLVNNPCHQDPGGDIYWNEAWHPGTVNADGSQTLSVWNGGEGNHKGNPSDPWCLSSPSLPGSTAVVTVNLVSCPIAVATQPSWRWTQHPYPTAAGAAVDLATVYTITDQNGFCLQPGPSQWYYGDEVGKVLSVISVAPCNGSKLQKWNADPQLLPSDPFGDTSEK
jgi:hypothetical protein